MKNIEAIITQAGWIILVDAKTKAQLFRCNRLKLAQEWLQQEKASVVRSCWL